MLTVSRRGLLASAAFTATAFTATFGHKGLAFPSPAHAETSLEPTTGFYKYKVGSIEVTAVYDGIWRKPHDPTFIKNASVEETKAALANAGLTTEFMPIPLTVIVLKIGDRHIMVDAGSGVRPMAGERHASAGQHERRGYRPQPDQLHPGLAFSPRSRLGADGERHQRARLSQRRTHRQRHGIQMVDGARSGREAGRRSQGSRQAHRRRIPDVEELEARRG